MQSTHPALASPRRYGAFPPVYDEPVSKSHCQQLGSSRSQGHRRPDPAFCLHGEKRTLTVQPTSTVLRLAPSVLSSEPSGDIRATPECPKSQTLGIMRLVLSSYFNPACCQSRFDRRASGQAEPEPLHLRIQIQDAAGFSRAPQVPKEAHDLNSIPEVSHPNPRGLQAHDRVPTSRADQIVAVLLNAEFFSTPFKSFGKIPMKPSKFMKHFMCSLRTCTQSFPQEVIDAFAEVTGGQRARVRLPKTVNGYVWFDDEQRAFLVEWMTGLNISRWLSNSARGLPDSLSLRDRGSLPVSLPCSRTPSPEISRPAVLLERVGEDPEREDRGTRFGGFIYAGRIRMGERAIPSKTGRLDGGYRLWVWKRTDLRASSERDS